MNKELGPYLFFGVPMACYLAQGYYVYFQQGRWGMAFAMAGYSLANIGLIYDALTTRI